MNKSSSSGKVIFSDKSVYVGELENEFYETLRGDGDILSRPKFIEMLEFCDRNQIKTIVFENTTRFSRDLICSETGYVYLKGLGYTLISSESPESFVDDSPTSVLIRRVLGCLSEFEKNSTVKKLKGSRIRKRPLMKDKGIITRNGDGKVEGRVLLETRFTTKIIRILRQDFSTTYEFQK